MFNRVLRSPDEAGGGAAAAPAAASPKFTDVVLPLRGSNGMIPDLRLREPSFIGSGALSDASVRNMMADVCHFLRQIVSITSAVVETIGIGQVRKIVCPELAIPRGVISEEGKISDKPTAPEPDPSAGSGQASTGRDHRKGPRGAKHPLTVLIQIAVQAAKLLEKIAAGTNPIALDREPLAERRARADAANTSRETAAMWRGR